MRTNRDELLQLILGAGTLVAYNQNMPDHRDPTKPIVVLEDWDGWDEIPERSLKLKPALYRDRSFVGTNGRITQREISVTYWIRFPIDQDISGVRNAIRTIAESSSQGPITLVRYIPNGSGGYTEKAREVISNVRFQALENYDRDDNDVRFNLVFICPDPWKTVYLNGSRNPEPGKRL